MELGYCSFELCIWLYSMKMAGLCSRKMFGCFSLRNTYIYFILSEAFIGVLSSVII